MPTERAQKLGLYTVFHLNLAYSSIEEKQRPRVIRRCYWPLLRLARELHLPLGIEATGYTLETIADLDPAWLRELRRLTSQGLCEFIGSGYAQIIGPLAPPKVNAANLRLGHEAYKRLLGFKPRIALINEQAYSAGLVEHYVKAGYKAVVMEWDNPARLHPEWDPKWRYLPQRACGTRKEDIPLLWSKSIAFQKFQRYAHGETELDEYLTYLSDHVSDAPRAFPLYANDAEIFDFRPGRYETEASLHAQGEWNRIRMLFETLAKDGRFRFMRPSQVLDLMKEPGAGNRLQLGSPEQPIPVKKQGKYNITRWAVTGPDDLASNTACWRLYKALERRAKISGAQWKELCYLWSSDFRTHITASRWRKYWRRTRVFEHKLGLSRGPGKHSPQSAKGRHASKNTPQPAVLRDGRFLTVATQGLRVRLNCQRGLAIDGIWPKGQDQAPWCGTLPHGYYDDISLGSDWYTGHAVLEAPGQSKVTDLNPVEPSTEIRDDLGQILIRAAIPTRLGPVEKCLGISLAEPLLTMTYRFHWKKIPLGSFRIGHITLHPDAFKRSELRYRTENGGFHPEQWPLRGKTVEHGTPVSFLVSARHGLGMTGGWVELGDNKRSLRVEADQSAAALIGMLSYRELRNTYFCRLFFSAGEMDETRQLPAGGGKTLTCSLSLRFQERSS